LYYLYAITKHERTKYNVRYWLRHAAACGGQNPPIKIINERCDDLLSLAAQVHQVQYESVGSKPQYKMTLHLETSSKAMEKIEIRQI
jgi:hypothetical protein